MLYETRRALAVLAVAVLAGCGEEAPAMPEARPADFEITVVMTLGGKTPTRTIEIATGHGEDRMRERDGEMSRKAFKPTAAELDRLYHGLRAVKLERIASAPHRRGSNISGRTIRIAWSGYSKAIDRPAREEDSELLDRWLGELFRYVRDKTHP